MSDAVRRDSDAEVIQLYSVKHQNSRPVLSDGGGGGTSDGMDLRITALEKGFEKLDGKIDKLTELLSSFALKTSERLGAIEGRLTGIEKTLDAKASTADLREVSGKISSIPTTWQTVAIIAGLLVGIGTISVSLLKLAGH